MIARPIPFPIFTPEVRAALTAQTEAEFMQAFDAFLEAELDEAIAAEIAAEDDRNAAWQDTRRHGTPLPPRPPAAA